ncbi:hypothetical protein [Aquimarina litoralis]|uniref:hypothetical protein n=1 Tax=Aquimarina litoralis TaxID=584605 RepID=UPI001C5762FD|nr:hypothetical protein [Aquimarina litoralis]MBW1294860.1 hypothetical protein [Aquimarina litoralis]
MINYSCIAKKRIQRIRKPLLLFILLISVCSCKIADLRTTNISDASVPREPKAIELINTVIENQGLDVLESSETYSYKAIDHWKGIFSWGNPFPENKELMVLKFRPNSFDGQFHYPQKKNYKTYGLQSMNYYEINHEGTVNFKNNKKIQFALPAIQYLFELPLRLRNVPILKYAGEQLFEGEKYDLVFATWNSVEPNKKYDQYLLYISKDGYLNFASYTVRESSAITPKNIYGSIRYENRIQNADGIQYPSTLYIQLNALKENTEWIRKLTISDVQLNSFPISDLYPNATIEFMGDSKN